LLLGREEALLDGCASKVIIVEHRKRINKTKSGLLFERRAKVTNNSRKAHFTVKAWKNVAG
jgi:hypothetical protein